MRVKLSKIKQREFLKEVMERVGAPSLRELSRRVDVSYSTMKNYFVGFRLLPKSLFENLCEISGLNFGAEFFEENWGQSKGGKISKRGKIIN